MRSALALEAQGAPSPSRPARALARRSAMMISPCPGRSLCAREQRCPRPAANSSNGSNGSSNGAPPGGLGKGLPPQEQINSLSGTELSRTATEMWERIKAAGMAVKVSPSISPGAEKEKMVRDGALAKGVNREQQLLAKVEALQEDRLQLANRAEMLVANVTMLEAKNSRLARELEAAEAARASAVRLRDMLLAERDTLAAQLAEATAAAAAQAQQQQQQQQAAQAAQAAPSSSSGSLASLLEQQAALQGRLADTEAGLRAVDATTDNLRSQLAALDAVEELEQLADAVQQQLQQQRPRPPPPQPPPPAPQQAAAAAAPPPAASRSPSPSDAAAADAAAAAEAARSQLALLRDAAAGATAALDAARQELGVLRSENTALAERAQSLSAANAELAAAVSSLRKQVMSARTELTEQRHWLDEQKRALEEARQLNESQGAELAGLRGREGAAAAERERLAAELAELRAVRDAAAAGGAGLVELAGMGKQMADLQASLSASKASEADLKRRLAGAEVALLDARRAAAASEERLGGELAAVRRDAASLRAALHARTLAAVAAKRARAPGGVAATGEGQFVNANRFWVPPELLFDFVKAVAAREVALVEAEGFLNLAVRTEGETVTVTTQWASIPAFEAWSRSAAARRHHYPSGVYQYVPKRGEGFPEDFVPFKDMDEPVNAKYA